MLRNAQIQKYKMLRNAQIQNYIIEAQKEFKLQYFSLI